MIQESLSKSYADGLQIASMEGFGYKEYFITAQQQAQGNFPELACLVVQKIKELGAAPVALDVFGVPGEELPHLQQAFGELTCPVTWLEGRKQQSAVIYGIQAWAVAGPTVMPVLVGDVVAGMTFRAEGVCYCRLGGLIPNRLDASRRDQTQMVFDLMERALSEMDMTFANVVRTWFYNWDLLDWYKDFNAVRTRFFIQREVFDRLMPASTGIGCRNGHNAALIAGLLAVKGEENEVGAFSVPSPLQRPSFEYGSAFSRAVELTTGGFRRLLVSGTASIAPQGESVHIGDVCAQIHLTLDVVQAMLESRSMSWDNIVRAIAYVKHAEDTEALDKCMAARGMASIPVLLAHTDICRDDLLFELEADAIV